MVGALLNTDFSIDEVHETSQSGFLANVTVHLTLECLQDAMPFLMNQNSINDSQYKLNSLDLIELLIGVVSKDILITKFKQSLKESQEKQQQEQGAKKNRKPVKNNRNKMVLK